MYILAFNGPPYCGKDTLARMVADELDSHVTLPVKEESLSLPLREIAYKMVGLNYPDGMSYDEFKTTHFSLLNATGRQLMIDVSEKFLKPCYGIEIMAKLLLVRNESFGGILLVRDSGFQIEVDPLIQAIGAKNLFIVTVARPNCDFSNDSREWVYHPNPFNQMAIVNSGTLDDLRTEAGRIYGRLVNQMGWKL